MTFPISRYAALFTGALSLCAGVAQANLIGPTAQVTVSNCIGPCLLGPALPVLGLFGGTSIFTDPVLAAGARNDDNGADNDSAMGNGQSTYGGPLHAYAEALSQAPLDATGQNTGSGTLSVWLGEFTVAGTGDVPLDMGITASGTLFAGADSSGRVEMGVQMGAISVAAFDAALAAGGLLNPDLLAFFLGNVFSGTAAVEADGAGDPLVTTAGADMASVVVDSTACTVAAVDCTLTAGVTANPADKGITVTGGENVLVYAAFGGTAVADLHLPGMLYMDGLNSMAVTPGADFTLVLAAVDEPATLLLLAAALAGLALRPGSPARAAA